MALDIWSDLVELEARFDDLFRGLPAPFVARTKALATSERPFRPAMDVVAHDGELMVKLDLPGIDPVKDLTVTVEEGRLVIRGKREEKIEVKEDEYYRLEINRGAFERMIPLPETFDLKKISATYENGVLVVKVPAAHKVAETPRVHKIPIAAAAAIKA